MAQPSSDHWSSEAYQKSAGFVPLLTSKVVDLLDLQPTDSVLDIGCGDGVLTVNLAAQTTGPVVGFDSSASMIATAEKTRHPNCTFAVQNCTNLTSAVRFLSKATRPPQFDKIFSNAAIHWILSSPAIRHSSPLQPPPSARQQFFTATATSLKPNGVFAAEWGGAGNVAEMHVAFTAALMRRGFSAKRVREEISPWWFPDELEVRGLLEGAGLRVEVCEREYRSTKLGQEGVRGWAELMGRSFVEAAGEYGGGIVDEVCEMVEGTTRRDDGGAWLGYVRLRVKARRV
ncbi:MAG: hypothetical protein M1814_000316 [Vezdaea aestivalis]|nr:MAG: hypothetical protein M1814_000316 [Vezdaea aestivalis]